MVYIPQIKFDLPTKEELQKLSEDYHKYLVKYLAIIDKFEERSKESNLVVKLHY